MFLSKMPTWHAGKQNISFFSKCFILIYVILKLVNLILHFFDLINYSLFIKLTNPLQFLKE